MRFEIHHNFLCHLDQAAGASSGAGAGSSTLRGETFASRGGAGSSMLRSETFANRGGTALGLASAMEASGLKASTRIEQLLHSDVPGAADAAEDETNAEDLARLPSAALQQASRGISDEMARAVTEVEQLTLAKGDGGSGFVHVRPTTPAGRWRIDTRARLCLALAVQESPPLDALAAGAGSGIIDDGNEFLFATGAALALAAAAKASGWDLHLSLNSRRGGGRSIDKHKRMAGADAAQLTLHWSVWWAFGKKMPWMRHEVVNGYSGRVLRLLVAASEGASVGHTGAHVSADRWLGGFFWLAAIMGGVIAGLAPVLEGSKSDQKVMVAVRHRVLGLAYRDAVPAGQRRYLKQVLPQKAFDASQD